MEMVQLNDLLPPEKREMYWTILGHQHEELPDDKEYVIFEHYCSTPDCYCESLVAEIQEIGPEGEPLGKPAAVISYDWSSDKTRCHASLLETSPMTKTALSLLEVYEKHVHQDEYIARIKSQYAKVKELAVKWEPAINRNRNIGRNDLCPCGSNKKYKKCCLN